MNFKKIALATIALLGVSFNSTIAKDIELLNVSYDPTRELYQDYNKIFAEHWKEKTGDVVKVKQSHGGSGKQARSVIEGLKADVVTLALAYDIDSIAKKSGFVAKDWEKNFKYNSSPYKSTIVFLVRTGNPKNIKDWNDLIRDDVKVITPNPKTSGGARWNYLAAWGYAEKAFKNDNQKVFDFMKKLFTNVPVLDTGARGSTTTFVRRGIGDVLLSWENEAFLAERELGKGQFETVLPSLSILAEPSVAVVNKVVEKNGNAKIAKAYLEYLYSNKAQNLVAEHFYRPANPKIAKKYEDKFPKLELLTIKDFGGWTKAQKEHFDDNGTFDQIMKR